MNYRFELLKGYYIRPLDKENWVLGKTVERTSRSGEKYKSTIEDDFFQSMQSAWNYAVEMLPRLTESKHELLEVLDKLEKLKLDIDSK